VDVRWIEAGLHGLRGGVLMACGILLVELLLPFAPGARVPASAWERAGANSSPAPASVSYDVIASRNLFQAVRGSARSAPAPQRFRESSLSVKLLGVAAPLAAVLQEANGKRRVIGPDDVIEGAKIERIEPRRVIVRNQGRLEALEMERKEVLRSFALQQRGEESHARIWVSDPAAPRGARRKPARSDPVPAPEPRAEPQTAVSGPAAVAFPESVASARVDSMVPDAQARRVPASGGYSAVTRPLAGGTAATRFSARAREPRLAEFRHTPGLPPAQSGARAGPGAGGEGSGTHVTTPLRAAVSPTVGLAQEPR
jgi:hypothetical protein